MSKGAGTGGMNENVDFDANGKRKWRDSDFVAHRAAGCKRPPNNLPRPGPAASRCILPLDCRGTCSSGLVQASLVCSGPACSPHL